MNVLTRRIALTILFVPLIHAHLSADVKRVAGEAGIERIFGSTLYRIGGEVTPAKGRPSTLHYPVSELEFPLDVFWLALGATVQVTDEVRLCMGFKTNINRDAGKMKDSDWGYWYLSGKPWADYRTLDVYSISDANLAGYVLNLDALYRVVDVDPFSLHVGAGFLYQYFDYQISNLDQWYPSYNRYSAHLSRDFAGHDYVRDIIMTYQVEYFVPYVQAVPEIKIAKTALVSGQIGFSPYAIARDTDDHILRSKIMHGSSTGWSFMAALRGEYSFSKTVSAGVQLSYLWIWTKGAQSQSFYETTDESNAGYIGSIENRVITEQYAIRVSASYAF